MNAPTFPLQPFNAMNAGELFQLLSLEHVGRERGISCADLAKKTGLAEREIRHVVTQLRQEGKPICAHPSTGYFIAASDEELFETIRFLRDRGMHHLQLAASIARVPLPDYLGQLRLPT